MHASFFLCIRYFTFVGEKRVQRYVDCSVLPNFWLFFLFSPAFFCFPCPFSVQERGEKQGCLEKDSSVGAVLLSCCVVICCFPFSWFLCSYMYLLFLLFSLISKLFSLLCPIVVREGDKTKKSKLKIQLGLRSSWDTRTRTRNDRTRICSVTITPYPIVFSNRHCLIASAKVRTFFFPPKLFPTFFCLFSKKASENAFKTVSEAQNRDFSTLQSYFFPWRSKNC